MARRSSASSDSTLVLWGSKEIVFSLAGQPLSPSLSTEDLQGLKAYVQEKNLKGSQVLLLLPRLEVLLRWFSVKGVRQSELARSIQLRLLSLGADLRGWVLTQEYEQALALATKATRLERAKSLFKEIGLRLGGVALLGEWVGEASQALGGRGPALVTYPSLTGFEALAYRGGVQQLITLESPPKVYQDLLNPLEANSDEWEWIDWSGLTLAELVERLRQSPPPLLGMKEGRPRTGRTIAVCFLLGALLYLGGEVVYRQRVREMALEVEAVNAQISSTLRQAESLQSEAARLQKQSHELTTLLGSSPDLLGLMEAMSSMEMVLESIRVQASGEVSLRVRAPRASGLIEELLQDQVFSQVRLVGEIQLRDGLEVFTLSAWF